MKQFFPRQFLIVFMMTVTLFSYQNCSILNQSNRDATSGSLSSNNLDVVIKNSRTFSIKIQTDLPKLTNKQLVVKGSYSYPSRGRSSLVKIPLENMHLFYSCSETPKYCELTFKIPEQNEEIDLSQLYSQNSVLEFKLYNASQKLENEYKVSMNSKMLKEIYSEVVQ